MSTAPAIRKCAFFTTEDFQVVEQIHGSALKNPEGVRFFPTLIASTLPPSFSYPFHFEQLLRWNLTTPSCQQMPSGIIFSNVSETVIMAHASFSELINSDTPTLLDFHAEWCGPCKMMKPILEELKSSLGDKVRIIQIDVDKNPKLAEMFQVRGVPTFAIFKNGELKWMQAGMQMLQQLKEKVEQFSGETVDH